MLISELIEITPEMIDAGITEYLRPYSNEDDPAIVVKDIFLAMLDKCLCQALSPEDSINTSAIG